MGMTPEMFDEIEAGLIERTEGMCVRIEQDVESSVDGRACPAFGVVIIDVNGCVLTVECKIADDGTAQITATKYIDGEPIDPFVFTMPGSVMVTT